MDLLLVMFVMRCSDGTDVSSGSMTHRATLDGSTEGVTCIAFDPAVSTAPEPGLYKTNLLLQKQADVCGLSVPRVPESLQRPTIGQPYCGCWITPSPR